MPRRTLNSMCMHTPHYQRFWTSFSRQLILSPRHQDRYKPLFLLGPFCRVGLSAANNAAQIPFFQQQNASVPRVCHELGGSWQEVGHLCLHESTQALCMNLACCSAVACMAACQDALCHLQLAFSGEKVKTPVTV